MNIADEINEVIRKITTSGKSHQVVLERPFDTDVTDLWNACTNPQRLSQWFEPVRGDLTLSGRYTLTKSGTEGDILRCEAPQHLAITWEYQGDVSHVDVDFIPTAEERAVLRVTHLVPPDDHWETYGPAATGVGWEECLRALSLYFTGGARCVFGEMRGYASTPKGRELTRLVADAWRWADQEVATPANIAEVRALNTAAFYLDRT